MWDMFDHSGGILKAVCPHNVFHMMPIRDLNIFSKLTKRQKNVAFIFDASNFVNAKWLNSQSG